MIKWLREFLEKIPKFKAVISNFGVFSIMQPFHYYIVLQTIESIKDKVNFWGFDGTRSFDEEQYVITTSSTISTRINKF